MASDAVAVPGELGWLVVSKDEAEAPFELHLLHAGHARLDERSVVATQRAVEPCRAQPANAQLLVLLSGGTSALPGGRRVARGAARAHEISDEMNDVRGRHGAALDGRPLRATRARALVVSDVLSGELRTILRSPFHPDDPTPDEPARLHVEIVASPQTLLDEAVTALTEFERRTSRACVPGKRRSSSGSRRSR